MIHFVECLTHVKIYNVYLFTAVELTANVMQDTDGLSHTRSTGLKAMLFAAEEVGYVISWTRQNAALENFGDDRKKGDRAIIFHKVSFSFLENGYYIREFPFFWKNAEPQRFVE